MRIFAILKFLNPRGSFASFADKFVYRGIAAGRACLVSVRSSSIPGIFSRSWSFPFFEQLPDRGGSKRFESETETYEEEKKEGTNYVLVKKKKWQVSTQMRKHLSPLFSASSRKDPREKTLDIVKKIRLKIFVRRTISTGKKYLFNNRGIFKRTRDRVQLLIFLVGANFLSTRKYEVCIAHLDRNGTSLAITME